MNLTTFFGQYIPKNSFVHSLNPIIKIIVLATSLGVLFTIKSLQALTIMVIFTLLLMYMTKIKIHDYLKINRFFLLFAAVISSSNFIINKFANVTTSAPHESLLILIRLFILTMINSIFLFTTPSSDIVKSIEFILYPLKYLKINIREIALTTSLAIKFLPIIFGEINKIILAHTSRGVNFHTKNLYKKVKNYLRIIPPLLVSTLKKSDDLAASIFSRCYSPYSPRTKFKTIKIQKYDIIFLAVSISIIIGVIICNNTTI